MAVVYFEFYAELNYFLPSNKREVKIAHFLGDKASVKDVIESLGIPHPEVDCIQANDGYVDFSYIVEDGDDIKVYPITVGSSLEASVSVRPKPLSTIRFVLDIHLGKLATSLRLLGFDTLYWNNDCGDEELAHISSTQERILLTRDKGLLMRGAVTHGYYMRQTNPQKQIVEVMQRFNLFELVSPFCRCIRCNGLLRPVAKELVFEDLPESVRSLNHEFRRCEDCGQVYWKGSHYQKLQQFIESVMGNKT
jgi:uncharacterized protein